MRGIVFLFVGIVLIAVGIIVSQSNMKVKINRQRANAEDSKTAISYVAWGLEGLGGIFALIGVMGVIRGKKQNKRNHYILQNGISAEGTVTFVDKNYAVLVNKKPIYSIVEYTYVDSTGSQHTRKVSNISSDIVIRKQILVGSKIQIKYASENPSESVMVLA
ncbi:MAG: DUF3592 domain-containing protein [Bacteroidota bacterium]